MLLCYDYCLYLCVVVASLAVVLRCGFGLTDCMLWCFLIVCWFVWLWCWFGLFEVGCYLFYCCDAFRFCLWCLFSLVLVTLFVVLLYWCCFTRLFVGCYWMFWFVLFVWLFDWFVVGFACFGCLWIICAW